MTAPIFNPLPATIVALHPSLHMVAPVPGSAAVELSEAGLRWWCWSWWLSEGLRWWCWGWWLSEGLALLG